MLTLNDIRSVYGLSPDQVRDRVRLLQPFLGHDVHRGPRGRIAVGDEFRAALDRMIQLERGGLGPREARERIVQELKGGNGSGPKETPTGPTVAPEVSELVNELRSRIAYLEKENERLWQLVNERLPALPAVASEPRTPLQRLWGAIFGGRS